MHANQGVAAAAATAIHHLWVTSSSLMITIVIMHQSYDDDWCIDWLMDWLWKQINHWSTHYCIVNIFSSYHTMTSFIITLIHLISASRSIAVKCMHACKSRSCYCYPSSISSIIIIIDDYYSDHASELWWMTDR